MQGIREGILFISSYGIAPGIVDEWNDPTLKHSNLALRVKLQVFRPKADMTIHFSQSWGEDLVRYIDGERSKDYVVRDRHRAKGVQMEQT